MRKSRLNAAKISAAFAWHERYRAMPANELLNTLNTMLRARGVMVDDALEYLLAEIAARVMGEVER